MKTTDEENIYPSVDLSMHFEFLVESLYKKHGSLEVCFLSLLNQYLKGHNPWLNENLFITRLGTVIGKMVADAIIKLVLKIQTVLDLI